MANGGKKWSSFKEFLGILDSSGTKEFLEQVENDRREELKAQQLKFYENFLINLASKDSSEMFSNGGRDYASILMSVLFNNTDNIARIYCKGFRKDLIMTDYYWPSLKKYLEDKKHKLKVMVETAEHVKEEPLQLLRRIINERNAEGKDNTIEVKVITPDSKNEIIKKYGEECNFAVFDDTKFRYEYDPINFKAYGSFNQPETCKKLKEVFETAFSQAVPLFE